MFGHHIITTSDDHAIVKFVGQQWLQAQAQPGFSLSGAKGPVVDTNHRHVDVVTLRGHERTTSRKVPTIERRPELLDHRNIGGNLGSIVFV